MRKIEAVVAVKRVGLQNAGVAAEMPLEMLPRSIACVEQSRRRILASECRVVADIHQNPPGFCLAFGKDRHRGVVAVQPIGPYDTGFDQCMQRAQRRGAGAHLSASVDRLSATPSRASRSLCRFNG
jgi:hypothetical protein